MTKNKLKDKNMFVWEPIPNVKIHLYLILRMKPAIALCFDNYKFEKTKGWEQITLNSNKEPFQHKRVLQNAMVLNKTITACNET